jgi:ubiquinone/menaquinone biosynthesis C-methylase UbiE
MRPHLVEYVPKGATVNEYGSGTGRAVVRIRELRPEISINMIDIADNALEGAAKALLGQNLTLHIGPLWKLPDGFPMASWGYCIDVLMTVAPEKLDEILAEIRRTCRNLFMQVYDMPDVRLGVNFTRVMQPNMWWFEKMHEYWPHVEYIQSKEHARRFIFICRSLNEVIDA